MELTAGLACRRLDFTWPGEDPAAGRVLNAVEATFPSGTLSLVTGASGTGKSTLLHLLAGLLRPTAGEVWADGAPVSRWTALHRDHWRRQVGIVFQHLALMPDLSVAENLLAPLIPRPIEWRRMQQAIDDQLAAVGLPALARAPAYTLSGGQRQRLALARALVGRPRFLLADEPTAYQDDARARDVIARLADAAAAGAVVVVCSHDPRLRQSELVNRAFRLDAGRLAPMDDHRGTP
jgi:putative ABC transport system ATP-binding protein